MSDYEYLGRQQAAKDELERLGIYRIGVQWLRKNWPPDEWTGTPLEWVLEEMPVLPEPLRRFKEAWLTFWNTD